MRKLLRPRRGSFNSSAIARPSTISVVADRPAKRRVCQASCQNRLSFRPNPLGSARGNRPLPSDGLGLGAQPEVMRDGHQEDQGEQSQGWEQKPELLAPTEHLGILPWSAPVDALRCNVLWLERRRPHRDHRVHLPVKQVTELGVDRFTGLSTAAASAACNSGRTGLARTVPGPRRPEARWRVAPVQVQLLLRRGTGQELQSLNAACLCWELESKEVPNCPGWRHAAPGVH